MKKIRVVDLNPMQTLVHLKLPSLPVTLRPGWDLIPREGVSIKNDLAAYNEVPNNRGFSEIEASFPTSGWASRDLTEGP